jgi:hypothetical protein
MVALRLGDESRGNRTGDHTDEADGYSKQG